MQIESDHLGMRYSRRSSWRPSRSPPHLGARHNQGRPPRASALIFLIVALCGIERQQNRNPVLPAVVRNRRPSNNPIDSPGGNLHKLNRGPPGRAYTARQFPSTAKTNCRTREKGSNFHRSNPKTRACGLLHIIRRGPRDRRVSPVVPRS